MKPEDLARLADDSRFEATPEIVSRARGAMLASACGDALGVPYEFAAPTDSPEMIGGGLGPRPGKRMLVCADGSGATKETVELFTRWRVAYSVGFRLPDPCTPTHPIKPA